MKGNSRLRELQERIVCTLKQPRLFQQKQFWLVTVLLIVLTAGLVIGLNTSRLTMLVIDGKPLAVIDSPQKVEEALTKIKDEYSQLGYTLSEMTFQITYDDSLAKDQKQPISEEELYNILKNNIDWQVACGAIIINGQPAIYLASEDLARTVLEEVKQYYLPAADGQVNVEQVSFNEDVQVTTGQAMLAELAAPEEAVRLMVQGRDKLVQHTIRQGDSLWTIARENGITVEDLRAANPDLKGDLLKQGMVLNLVKAEPLVNVVATLTTTVEEKIPFKTVYENDSSMWKGQQKVKQAGIAGSRQVTYRVTKTNNVETAREELVSKLISEPVSQVVVRGTKAMVASRGGGGNGVLGWPTRGNITSGYGVRRSTGTHGGIDIDGDKGDPIFAAEAGVVLEAGWAGTYGYCVIIDHGDGLSTLYGHLSKINVSIGQQVQRGDIIGLMGSTGRSTGSHLHFEVRINGIRQNPLRFLEQ